MRAVLALTLAVSLPLLASCGDKDEGLDCTEIGCTDGLEITFAPQLQTAGDYEVLVETEGLTITCTASLPLVGELSTCDAADVYLGSSGSALDASEHRLTGVYLPSGPAEVLLTVSRDGEEILSTTLSPTYEELAPNGVECGPVCSWAAVEVSVSSP